MVRAQERYPQLRAVDVATYVAIVDRYLEPLPADRLWSRRRWQVRRGEAVWVERYGLHAPTPREAS